MPVFPAPSHAHPPAGGPSRRSVVVAGFGAIAGVVLAGCSNEPAKGSRKPAAPAGLAPDVNVATKALAEIEAVRLAVGHTLKRFPEARGTLAPLMALHRTHEATLVDAVPERARPSSSPAPYRVPRRQAKALASVAAREQRLHDTLDTLALRAQSGQFARLLASMGTALHQRLAEWSA